MKTGYIVMMAALMTVICGLSSTAVAETVTVTDMAGREVTAPLNPERVIGLGPGALRLLVYLQAQEQVCGVEAMENANPHGRPYWMAYPELARLPRCGPGGPPSINKKPDLEAVLGVRPQVMFVTYMDKPLADDVEKTIGIPVVVLSYGVFATFDKTVYQAFRIAGKILDRDKRAESIIQFIETNEKDLDRRTRDIPEGDKPGVYVGGVGFRAAHGVESTEQRYRPFDWVHARNLADQLPRASGSHVFAGREQILALNPEVLFLDGAGLAILEPDIRKHGAFYRSLRAFQTGRVFVLYPFNAYTTNIGTALADAYAVGKILYPDRFADIDVAAKAGDIYRFMLGRDVYPEMKKVYGTLGERFAEKKINAD